MIIKKADQKTAVVHGLAGGKGDAHVTTLLPAEESANTGRLFATVTLQPGESVGYHKHEGEYEIYWILDGTGVITEDGKEYTAEPGDLHQCKSGSMHGIENRSSAPVSFLAFIIFCK